MIDNDNFNNKNLPEFPEDPIFPEEPKDMNSTENLIDDSFFEEVRKQASSPKKVDDSLALHNLFEEIDHNTDLEDTLEQTMDLPEMPTEVVNLKPIMKETLSSDKNNGSNDQKKKKKTVSARLLWAVLLVTSLIFFVVFFMMPMFPFKWSIYLAVILTLVLCLTGYFSFCKIRKKTVKDENGRKKTVKPAHPKLAIKIINVFLSILMVIGSCLLPYYKWKVSKMINTNNSMENMVLVNLYVMSDQYKAEHPDRTYNLPEVEPDAEAVEANELKKAADDTYKGEPTLSESQLKEFRNCTFISTKTVDTTYQESAFEEVEKLTGNSNLNTLDEVSVLAAAERLYNGEGDIMVMTAQYASMLGDMDGFETFDTDTRIIYSIALPEREIQIKKSDADLCNKPFSIFIGGNDTEGELNLSGRTDVDIVVTVNPQTHNIAICSFPRDSYVANPALGNRPDKLTHLGVSGLDNTLKGLGTLLDTNVDNYVLLNFTTYIDIIGVLGGVDVYNPYEFYYSYDNSAYFPEGDIHLVGWDALAYVRERHSLPDGDFGRNMHQQIVLKALIQKLASVQIISHFDSILTQMAGDFLTNLSDDSIYAFCKMQLDENIQWNIVNYRAEGGTGMAVCASAPSMELSVVYPFTNQIKFMQQVVQDVIDGKDVEQQDMPVGSGYWIQGIAGTPEAEETATPETTATPTPSASASASPTADTDVTPTEEPVETPVPQDPTPTPEEVVPTPAPTPVPTPETQSEESVEG